MLRMNSWSGRMLWDVFVFRSSSVRARGTSVGTAADYELDDRGSIPGMGKIFLCSTASRQALRPTQPPIQWVPGVKRPGHEGDHSPPSGAEVKDGDIPQLLHTSSWMVNELSRGIFHLSSMRVSVTCSIFRIGTGDILEISWKLRRIWRFSAIKLSEIFTGDQSHSCGIKIRCFGDCLCHQWLMWWVAQNGVHKHTHNTSQERSVTRGWGMPQQTTLSVT
jgi:hypothetical protein